MANQQLLKADFRLFHLKEKKKKLPFFLYPFDIIKDSFTSSYSRHRRKKFKPKSDQIF